MRMPLNAAAGCCVAATLTLAACASVHAQAAGTVPARSPGFGRNALFVSPHLGGEIGRFRAAGQLELGWGQSSARQGAASLSTAIARNLRLIAALSASAAATEHARRSDESVFLMLGTDRGRLGIGGRRSNAAFAGYTSGLDGLDISMGVALGTPLNLEFGLSRQSSSVVERGDLDVMRRIVVAGYEFTSVRHLEFVEASRHQDFELELAATLSRVRIAGIAGRGFSDGQAPDRSWLYGRVSAPLTRVLELLAEAGRNGGVPAVGRVPQSFARLGLRMNLNAPPPAPTPPTPPDFAVVGGAAVARIDLTSGEPRLFISAPHAAVVEVKGDFTAWAPVSMSRTEDGLWFTPVRPGVSHFNLRVDQGAWGVPAGVPVVPDEFNGAPVAVLLVRAQ
jgi:hypothetical protein